MDGNVAQRALKWSALIAVFAVVAGWAGGDTRTALGFAVGAGVGLFSLWGLTFAVPRFAGRPGLRPLVGMMYLLKLALIAAALWFTMTSPLIQPFAVFAGAAIVPVVIVTLKLKAALFISSEDWRERFRSHRRPRDSSSG